MIPSRSRQGLVLMLLLLIGCQVPDLRLWTANVPPQAVEEARDVVYYHGPERNAVRHTLDLYIPHGKTGFPVVVLVHGGAWRIGDNRCWGLYSAVGTFLASQGIGVIIPNYRLSPEVRHPAHVQDIARAIAWTRACVGKYGGDPQQIYLAGHSAGGHLVTLLATDASYLKAEGFDASTLKGVIAISGVYELPGAKQEVVLGGRLPSSVRLRQVAPLRDAPWEGETNLESMPFTVDVYGGVFGDDPDVRFRASPIHHVRSDLPPMLLLYAQHDLPTLPDMARRFGAALEDKGCRVTVQEIAKRNHNSILFSAIRREDAVARAIVEFIDKHE